MHTVWENAILFLTQPQAEARFDYLGWHHIGWTLQNWVSKLILPLAIMLAAIAVMLVISRWRATTTAANGKRKDSKNRLENAVQRYRISNDELVYCDVLQSFAGDEEIISIIEKPEQFERCVDAAIAAAEARSPEAAEDAAIIIAALRRKIGFAVYPIDKQLYSTRAIPVGESCAVYGTGSNKEPLVSAATVVINNERSMRLRYKPETVKTPVFGSSVRIAFSRANDGFYGAQVPVLGGPAQNTIELGHSANMKRSQLRKFVRVSANGSVRCRMIKPANPREPSLAPGQVLEAHMNDLSGGGISFTHAQSLHPGDMVSLSFHLASTRIAGLQGTVLRVSERNVKGQKEFLHHIKFTPIELNDQEKIVQFTFERMRLLTTWNIKRYK